MPIDVNSLKRKHGQNASNIPKKPPLTTSSPNKGDDSFFKEFDPAVVESDEELAKKRELISRLFDDNQELPMEEMLMYYFTQGEGKNMGKTVSPLKGIRVPVDLEPSAELSSRLARVAVWDFNI